MYVRPYIVCVCERVCASIHCVCVCVRVDPDRSCPSEGVHSAESEEHGPPLLPWVQVASSGYACGCQVAVEDHERKFFDQEGAQAGLCVCTHVRVCVCVCVCVHVVMSDVGEVKCVEDHVCVYMLE